MHKAAIFVFLMVLFCAVASSFSATIHVPSQQPTIQAGINAAEYRDTVLVAPGTYFENVILNKYILLKSTEGRSTTTIRPLNPNQTVVSIGASVIEHPTVDGFTIGYTQNASGVSCNGASVIQNCEIRDCIKLTGYGAGIYCTESVVIKNNRIINNTLSTGAGGGIAVGQATIPPIEVTGNELINNSATSGAAVAILTTGTAVYCEITFNLIKNNVTTSVTSGSITCYDCFGLLVQNNTIVSNTGGFVFTPREGLGYTDYPDILNNIVGLNTQTGLSTCTTGCNYNDVWMNGSGNYPGANGFSADPLFVDPANGFYQLTPGSPCIDAGHPAAQYNDPDGTRNDMGALFYYNELPPVLTTIGSRTGSEGIVLSFVVQASDTNGGFPIIGAYDLPQGAAFIDSSNGRGNFSWTPSYAQAGEYDILFVASDGELADSELVHITVQNVIRPPVIDSFAVDGLFAYQNLFNATPQFQWRYTDPEAIGQDSFIIAVGTDTDWQFAEKWNPAPFASSDTFVTYGGSELLDGQTYYLRLRVHNTLAWSDWYQTSFRMNSVPTPPVLRAPTNLVVVGSTPILWVTNGTDAETDPLTYEFAGFHDTDCVAGPAINLIGVASGVDSTGGQIVDPLAENCRYWWMARTFDGYEYSPWTSYGQFLVNGTPEAPTAPMLDYPPLPDNKPIFTLLPTLDWQISHDPDPGDTVRYKLELSDRANFSFALVRDSLLSTDLALTDSLLFGTHYYWRVTARDRTGLSAISGVKEFWTWKLGDVNHSHGTDLSDLSLLIAYLTQTPRPDISPKRVADLTGDCRIDLSDLSTMVAFMTTTGVVLQVGCE